MRTSRILVADLGASRVACAVFSTQAGGELQLEEGAVMPLPLNPESKRDWTMDVAAALREIGRDKRFRGDLVLTLPGHVALTKFIKTPAVGESKRSRIAEFEAGQNSPYPLGDVVWDHLLVSTVGAEWEMMFTAAKNEVMLPLCSAIRSVGFTLRRATPGLSALHEAFRHGYPDVRESSLLIDVGARCTHAVFVDGGRFFGRTLPIGGNGVTQSIADESALTFDAAELLKVTRADSATGTGAGTVSDSVRRAVRAFAGKLNAEITRATLNVHRQTSLAAPTRIYLTGGGSELERLHGLLGEAANLPVERWDATKKIGLSTSAHSFLTSSNFSIAPQWVGLAAAELRGTKTVVNLLPRGVREEVEFRRRQPVLMTAAGLLVLALVPPVLHFQSLTRATVIQATDAERQLHAMRVLKDRTTSLLKAVEATEKLRAQLKTVVNRKGSWLHFLADLHDRLAEVEDVWLESLSIDRGGPASEVLPTGVDAAQGGLRLVLSGRLLDRNNPVSKVSAESYDRVKQLIASIGKSAFVTGVERERFDNSEAGILRFDFTVVTRPEQSL